MKVAFFNVAAAGHVNPTRHIIDHLTEQGASVDYFVPTDYATRIQGPGIVTHAITDPADAGRGQPDPDVALVTTLTAAQRQLPSLVEATLAVRADGIVYDRSSPWGRWVAEALDVPAVQLMTTYAFSASSPRVRQRAQRFSRPRLGLKRALGKYQRSFEANCALGVAPIRPQDVFTTAAGLNIVTMSAAFQTDLSSFDGTYFFVGPCLPVEMPRPNESEPLAFVSTGSVLAGDDRLVRACVEAFRSTRWSVVLALGSSASRISSYTPSAWVVEEQVAQLDVLANANVFVTHGGMNSVMEALALGVPLVVVPRTPENERTAQRVAELRLGVAVELKTLDGPTMAGAVDQVVNDKGLRQRLNDFADEASRAGGSRRASELIFDHVQQAA